VVSWHPAVNACLPVHPTPSLPLAHVPPATQIARLVPGLHSISVQAAQSRGLHFRMAAAFRRVQRHNSLTAAVEVARRAIVPVRVVPVPAQVTASHAQAPPPSSAEDLVSQPTAKGMTELLSRASASVFRISSPSRRCQEVPFRFHFPPSRASTRPLCSTPVAVDVSRGGRYCS